MTSKLLPCPFCGHDEPTHDEGDQSAWVQCTNFECGMCGPIASGPSLAAAAWNRRATQPAAGEPVAEFFIEFDTLRRAMSIYGLSAPESNHELGSRMERYAIRVIEAVAKLPFPYPPAAAHGDDAVRKPELVGYFSFCEDKQKWLQQKSKGAEFNHLFTPLYAMRAQGDGGRGDA